MTICRLVNIPDSVKILQNERQHLTSDRVTFLPFKGDNQNATAVWLLLSLLGNAGTNGFLNDNKPVRKVWLTGFKTVQVVFGQNETSKGLFLRQSFTTDLA